MKMGTTFSPFPYDAAARHALQSVNLRRPAISRYAYWGDGIPASTPSLVMAIAAGGTPLRCGILHIGFPRQQSVLGASEFAAKIGLCLP
jgi:hypothetical protein